MEELIAVEERIKGAFCEQAIAFREIADDQLYKSAGYPTFDDYCDKRANCGARHGWRMVKAGTIIQKLLAAPIGELWLPANERQAREFSRIEEKDIEHAAQVVYDRAPKKNGEVQIAAEDIHEILIRDKFVKPPRKVGKAERDALERRMQLRGLHGIWKAFETAPLSADDAFDKFGDQLFTSEYENAMKYLLRLEELRNGG